MNAIIFIAHGSKKEKSNNEFIELIGNVSKKDTNYQLKKAAFLEAASPSIEACVEEFVKKEASSICLYPFFLNSGKHVLIDLPELLNKLKEEYPNVEFTLFDHFGKSDKIQEIVLNDINKAH